MQTSGWRRLVSSLQPCTSSSLISIQGKLHEECWTSSNIHFREYEIRVVMWEERLSDLSPVSPMALNPCEELSAGAERMWTKWKRPNRLRTGIWALQSTPPQMGILEGQLRSKLWLWPWAPVSFVGASIAEDLVDYNDTAQKCVQHCNM